MPDKGHLTEATDDASVPRHELDRAPRIVKGSGIWIGGELKPIQFEMDEDIHQKLESSHTAGLLGHPVSIKTEHLPDGIGRVHKFQKGAIFAHPQAGIHVIWGSFYNHYVELGQTQSCLGYPTSEPWVPPYFETQRGTSFQYGQMYWTQALGAHEVHGAILQKYLSIGDSPLLGPASFLGFPTSDECATPDGRGRYSHFSGGSIHWTPETGAFEVHGAIRDKWASLGWEQSPLGYPTSDETATPDGKGRFNHFQDSSIYWTPGTGACAVYGLIRSKWASLGWEQSALGFPTTDGAWTPDQAGAYTHFQGGSIYYTPETGTCAIYGLIRDKWASLGWEQGFLGYPTTDGGTAPDGVGAYSHFQGGSIYWTPGLEAHETHGAIREKWSELGWEQSFLGYPITDELPTGDGQGRYEDFQNGTIFWNSNQGATAVHGPVPYYIFRLTSFLAGITRSSDDDEPHEAMTVQIGSQPPATNAWTDGDDIEGGEWHVVNREIGPLPVEDSTSQVLFNFIITNQGHGDTSQIEEGLKTASTTLLSFGGLTGNPLALATAAVGFIISVLFADCDGIVAADQLAIGPQVLKEWTGGYDGNTLHFEQRAYAGTDSPIGCGSNSHYTVSFDIRRW